MNSRLSKLHIGSPLQAEDISRTRVLVHPALILLVVAAVLLRAGLSLALPRVIKWDEPMYLLLGHNLLTGNGFTWGIYPELHFPPLYPIVSGLFHLLLGDFERASNLAFALFGGLLLLPVFTLTRRIYGLQTAYLAAFLLAIFPALNVSVLYWGSMTEPLYLFLVYGGLAVLLVGLEDDRLGMFAGAGALFALAYLTRPEAVVYFGVFFIVATVLLMERARFRRIRAWSALGLLVLSFVLLAAPYIWYLHTHTGKWIMSGKMDLAWKAGDGGAGSLDLKAYDELTNGLDSSGKEIYWLSLDRFKVGVTRTVFADPSGLLKRMVASGRNLKDHFFDRTSFWGGLTPLVFVALFKKPWDRQRLRHEAFLVTIIIVLLLVFLPVGFLVRYFAPAFPVLLMWTARGALDLGAWLKDTLELCGSRVFADNKEALPKWLPAAMVAGFFLMTIPVAAQGGVSITFFGDKEAGLWLKANTPANAKVMTQELGIALYADRRYVPSPHADWMRFMEYARAHDANYLVVRTFKLEEYRPQLAVALEVGAPELDLLFSFDEPHMQGPIKTLIYHISSPVK